MMDISTFVNSRAVVSNRLVLSDDDNASKSELDPSDYFNMNLIVSIAKQPKHC